MKYKLVCAIPWFASWHEWEWKVLVDNPIGISNVKYVSEYLVETYCAIEVQTENVFKIWDPYVYEGSWNEFRYGKVFSLGMVDWEFRYDGHLAKYIRKPTDEELEKYFR